MTQYRSVYLRALNPENDFSSDQDVIAIQHEIRKHSDPDAADPDSRVQTVTVWSAAEAKTYAEAYPSPETATIRSVLANCAPLGLMSGAWLQWIPSTANADTELCLRVLELYADDVGVGYSDASRGSSYRALMRNHGLTDESPEQLPASEHIADISFQLAGQLLLMSRRPDVFTPELLGADLCLRATGTLPPLAVLNQRDEARRAPCDLNMGEARTPGNQAALTTSMAASRIFHQMCADGQFFGNVGTEDGVRRWAAGFSWAFAELRKWSAEIAEELSLALNPAYAMWRLIYSRSSQAAVYHDDYELDGRPLSEWFSAVDSGPEQFLRSLARSRLVRPGDPDRSRLVRGLIDYRGPMFRVFTENDIQVIRRWIASLPGADADDKQADAYHRRLHAAQSKWYRRSAPVLSDPARSAASPEVPSIPSISLREAYHLLLARQDSVQLRDFARAYVERWLARSRYRMSKNPEVLPGQWTAEEGLRQWLEKQHRKHGDSFRSDSDKSLPSKESLIDSTIQTAPLTLIDGGWIQGFTDYFSASTMPGHFLFETYWDELGNGQLLLNHPLIYRSLLSEMGVHLPPICERGFSEWEGFRDESFRLPVYWLCISRFSRSCMPEILGLNLAMELSGVGGGYRRMRRALAHYGFSTRFVDIHNTIDNVSTGHSAWAVEAIDSYMTSLASIAGPEMQHTMWHRIRVGHRSLTPPQGPLASCFARTLGRRGTPNTHSPRKRREAATSA